LHRVETKKPFKENKIMKKISQENYDLLLSGKHACPQNISFVVGKEYLISNPSNKNQKIKAICTQDCPYSLLKV
jgi:hypothetical protein